jgi:hypothetical protein
MPRSMPDQLSTLYSGLLEGSYDCVDRIVLNAYFGMGQTGDGLRVWWRELYGSDADLDDNHLIRMAGRLSRRLRAWAKANDVPVIYCSPGEIGRESGCDGLISAIFPAIPSLPTGIRNRCPVVTVLT